MKKAYFLFSVFFFIQCISYAQQAISYQAVARNSVGHIIPGQSIAVKFNLHQGSTAGSLVFTETHSTTTNLLGLFTLAVGSINTTQFQLIDWANGPFYLEIFMDPAGGSSFSLVGAQQLLSVPYALYAKTSGNAAVTTTISINAPNTITVPSAGMYSVTVPPQTLSVSGSSVSISNGNTIVLPAATTGSTYTAGSGISLTGNVITNTAPDQVVNITGSNVSGSYPNFAIAPYTSGSGISVSGNTITNTAPNQVVSISGTGVSGTYPNFAIASPSANTLTGTGLVSVTNSAPNFTVNVPTPSMAFNNATGTYTYTQGAYTNTINLSPNTAFSAGTLSVGSSTTLIPGAGIWGRSAPYVNLVNISDNVGMGIASPSEKLVVIGNVAIPPANQYKYLNPKTDYCSVSALAFNTEGTYNRTNNSGGVYISDGTAGVQGNFYAGVNLPNGAVITTLDAYVLDNDGLGGHDIAYIQLWRQDGAVGTSSGNSVTLAVTPGTSVTSSAIVKLTTTTITNPVVDNANYTYYVRVGSVQAAPNLILFKVVITYTITGVD